MPIAASTVPEDTSTEKPARAGLCEASTPMAPKAIVAMPPNSRTIRPKPADAPASLAEEQQRQAQHDVDADLGEDRERGPTGARRRIGARQPEAQRPHRRLDEEGDAEDGGAGVQQRAVLCRARCGMRWARSAMLSVPVTP